MKTEHLTHDEATAAAADGVPIVYTTTQGWHVKAPANDDSADEAQTDATVRRAAFEAAMIEWHASHARAAKATAAYEKNRNRNGNHTPPKNTDAKVTYKKAYYEGGYRMIIDGMPTRVAAHVKGWKASNKKALGAGFVVGGAIGLLF